MKILCESCGALVEARVVRRPGGTALACSTCGAETALPPATGAAPPGHGAGAPAPAAAGEGAAATPAATDAERPGLEAEASAPGEEEAWARLEAGWDDEGAHRAFLARFADLAGLARAGARYREVLAARPGDAAALHWREEILRRATALGLAEMPRSEPPRELPRTVKWGAVALLAGALLGAAAWVVWTLVGLGTMR